MPPRPPSPTLFPYTTLFRSLRGPSAVGAAAAGEPVAQERRSGSTGRHPGYGRHRGLSESGSDAARDGEPASVRLRADTGVRQARRLPAVPALDGNRRGQLRVLALEP